MGNVGEPWESWLHGEMRFNFYGDQIDVKFESRVGEPWESWLRLKYAMADYWTGEEVEIDDKIFLATTRPPFGGLRWWFVCPHLNRRVRKARLVPRRAKLQCCAAATVRYAGKQKHDRDTLQSERVPRATAAALSAISGQKCPMGASCRTFREESLPRPIAHGSQQAGGPTSMHFRVAIDNVERSLPPCVAR
jgi:hypothetical protein